VADRYWVTGGDGIFSSLDNWSTTSGGSSGSSVPTTGDTAFFDANSGSYFTVQVISSVLCSIDTTDSVSLSFWVTDGGHLSLNTVIELDSLAIDGTGVFNSNSYNITANYIYIQDTASAQFGTSAITATKTLWFWGTSSGDADVTGGSFYVNDDTNVQIINTTLTNSGISGADTYYATTSDGNVDGGGNTGFVFTLSGTLRYWVTDNDGDWADTANWSAISGGTGGASVPLTSGYTAVFDYNSFSGYYKTVTVQGISVACSIVNSSAYPFMIHEIPDSTIGTTFISLQNNLRVYGLQLHDTVSSNDYNIHAQSFVVAEYSSGLVPIIDLGYSNISIFDISGEYTPTFSICSSVTGGTENVSIFFMCRYGAYNKFESYGIGIGALYVQLIGACDFYSDGTTFGILGIESSGTDDWDGIKIMTEDAEITIGNESGLTLLGDSPEDRLLISPYNEGSTYTISMASGTCNAMNCSLTGCIATGGATFNALTSNGNVDSGNNTGWNFEEVVVNETDIPLFNISGSLGVEQNTLHGIITNPLFDVSGSIEVNENFIAGNFSIPMFSIEGQISQGPHATLSVTLPSLQFKAYSGAALNLTLPKIQFVANAHVDPVARLNVILPRLQFNAHAIQDGMAVLNVALPTLRFTAHAFISGIAQLNVTLPRLKFEAHALTGEVAQLNVVLPSLRFSAHAYWQGTNTLNIVLPKLQFSARARSNDVLVLTFNTKNFAQTEYDNTYSYNSLMNFNGKLVGLRRDGVYELNGDTDNGTSIDWYFKTGKIDLEEGQLKKARHVWLSYRPSGDLVLTVDDGENEYEYDVESYKQIDNAVRIKLGKGIRNRYIQLELRNVSNEKIFLDRMRLFTEPIAKKR